MFVRQLRYALNLNSGEFSKSRLNSSSTLLIIFKELSTVKLFLTELLLNCHMHLAFEIELIHESEFSTVKSTGFSFHPTILILEIYLDSKTIRHIELRERKNNQFANRRLLIDLT